MSVQPNLMSFGALKGKRNDFSTMYDKDVKTSLVSRAPKIPSLGHRRPSSRKELNLHRIYYSVTGGRDREKTG